MDKVLIELFVPSINRSYEMFIPTYLKIYEVLPLITKAITEVSEGMFFANQYTVICYQESGEIMNINLSVYESGIINGSKLMLI